MLIHNYSEIYCAAKKIFASLVLQAVNVKALLGKGIGNNSFYYFLYCYGVVRLKAFRYFIPLLTSQKSHAPV